MTKINTIETTLKAMHDEVQKLINGDLDKEGFDRLVEDAKELYEKMIILRYKAYEEKVFGISAEPKITEKVEEEKLKDEKPEEMKGESFFDGIEKVLPIEEKAEPEAPKDEKPAETPTEAPSFDFSLFENENEEEEEKSLGIDETPEIPEESSKVEETVPSVDLESSEEETPIQINHDAITSEEKLEEEPVEPQVIPEEKASIIEQAPFKPSSAEPAPSEEPVPSTEEKMSSTENWVQEQFISKFSKIDADEVQQLAISKLSTLLGAFGLNERLQCINELFDGSSEAFSEAIKVLDNAGTLDAAIKIASEFSVKYEWDLNSETVDEFVFKIKRRYA